MGRFDDDVRNADHRVRVAAVSVALALIALAACSSATGPARETGTARSSDSPSVARSTSAPDSAVPTTTEPSRRTVHHADATITRLTRSLGRRGVSIAAVDTTDGETFGFGARRGMLCASIAKLYILETLLLRHQRSGEPLGDETRELATAMIEHSDNDAANDLYVRIGEGAALRAAAPTLGIRHTDPGSGIYWGFTRTSAPAYLALLRDLIGPGPLDATSRHFALHLLTHVESDQRWGVGSVADPGTSFALKNGWLAVSTDDGRWAVNTVGIVTVHGRRLLLAVMTQHGAGFDGGVTLVDHLARVAATAVTSR